MGLQHAITSRRTPMDQSDPDVGMRINSLKTITRFINEVYAVFGVVDSFDTIVSFENSLDIFHCYALNSKMDDNSRYPDYKVYDILHCVCCRMQVNFCATRPSILVLRSLD